MPPRALLKSRPEGECAGHSVKPGPALVGAGGVELRDVDVRAPDASARLSKAYTCAALNARRSDERYSFVVM